MRRWLVAMMVAILTVAGLPAAQVGAAAKPAAPKIVKVETVRGAATLHWDAVSGAVGYNVYRNGRYLKTVTKSPYRDGNSPNAYTYYVTAFDSTKTQFSTRSNEVSADTRGTSVWPATTGGNNTGGGGGSNVPSLVAPSLSRIDTVRGAATLHWSPVSGAAGYNVYRNGRYLKTLAGGSTKSYRDGNSPNVYTYYVTAFDSTKKIFSPKSNELRADTRGTTTTGNDTGSNTGGGDASLAAPTITAIETSPGYAKFTFSEVAGAAGYNVYRNGRYLETIAGSPYDDRNSPGDYKYYFTAFDASKKNFSPKSVEHSVDTRSVSAQDEKGSVDPIVFHRVVSDKFGVLLEWDPSAGATKYNLHRDGKYLTTITNNGGRARFHDRSAVHGRTYTYRVDTIGSTGLSVSTTSKPIRFLRPRACVDAQTPNVAKAPINVVAKVVNNEEVELRWQAPNCENALFTVYKNGAFERHLWGTSIRLPYDLVTEYNFSVRGYEDNTAGRRIASPKASASPLLVMPLPIKPVHRYNAAVQPMSALLRSANGGTVTGELLMNTQVRYEDKMGAVVSGAGLFALEGGATLLSGGSAAGVTVPAMAVTVATIVDDAMAADRANQHLTNQTEAFLDERGSQFNLPDRAKATTRYERERLVPAINRQVRDYFAAEFADGVPPSDAEIKQKLESILSKHPKLTDPSYRPPGGGGGGDEQCQSGTPGCSGGGGGTTYCTSGNDPQDFGTGGTTSNCD